MRQLEINEVLTAEHDPGTKVFVDGEELEGVYIVGRADRMVGVSRFDPYPLEVDKSTGEIKRNHEAYEAHRVQIEESERATA